MTENCKETAKNSSYDRLITAVLDQWEQRGTAGISARQISAVAGAPVSSIYHHFGSLEHLFEISQDVALERARRWCDARLGQLPGTPEAIGGFLAQIIDDWAEGQRPLAFAWRECQLLAPGSEALRRQSRRWDALWQDFWDEAGDRFGLGPARIIAARTFDNESLLHMIRWDRMVDRAALHETGATLAAWLTGRAPPPSPWRDLAQEAAMRSMPVLQDRDDTAARIVAAASELIGTIGVANLTHRAVADRAGLTLGTVSHRFKTKSALLGAAFEGIYRRILARMGPGGTIAAGSTLDTLRAWMLRAIAMGAAERGQNELFLASAREPGLSQLGAQLRYLRGRTSGRALEAVLGPDRPVTHSECALFSGILTSQTRHLTPLPIEAAAAQLADETAILADLLAIQRAQTYP